MLSALRSAGEIKETKKAEVLQTEAKIKNDMLEQYLQELDKEYDPLELDRQKEQFVKQEVRSKPEADLLVFY